MRFIKLLHLKGFRVQDGLWSLRRTDPGARLSIRPGFTTVGSRLHFRDPSKDAKECCQQGPHFDEANKAKGCCWQWQV